MKITSKLLSIPPYISTAWENVSSLHIQEENGLFYLTIILHDGSQAKIPGLNKSAVSAIFEAHARYTESAQTTPELNNKTQPRETGHFNFTLPAQAIEDSIGALAAPLQHNPDQADIPPLPPLALQKIIAIAKSLGIYEMFIASGNTKEPDCNCIYCQVINAIEKDAGEEIVSDEDLAFRDWEIKQTTDNLYQVTNPLDANEQYNVFLGNPLGCTCGEKNCEHIRAVLST
jgi:hypothetical protein